MIVKNYIQVSAGRRRAPRSFLWLIDNNGNTVVEYYYDAWGNHKVVDANGDEIIDLDNIGNLNPFRYRGYYYDTETGLYFLQTRYYDPEVGRFLNRDSVQYADPETINGLNLYAYCLNNPVEYVDPTGEAAWYEWLGLVVVSALAIGAIIGGTILTGGATSFSFVGLMGSVLSGAGTGFLSGATASIALQGMATGWDFSKINPVNAMISGGVAAFIGGVGGIMSYGFQYFGETIGNAIGNYISDMSINGFRVGKQFSYLGGTKMIKSLFSGIGSFIGAVGGTYIANDGMNKVFGNNDTADENLVGAIKGEIESKIYNSIYRFFKWLIL